VKLGIIPGAGGTQRLPRLAGVEAALEMCCFGEPVHAQDALRLGIIDGIAEGKLLDFAMQFAKGCGGPRRTRDRPDRLGRADFSEWREKIRRARRHLTAPTAAIEAIQAAVELSFEDGCRKERNIFERLLVSSQAKALLHVFLGERAAGKIPGLNSNAGAVPVRTAAVVGAGTMGRGIAVCFANAGIPVVLKDTSQDALTAAMKSIESGYAGAVQKGRITAEEMCGRRSRIHAQTDYAGFDGADLIVESAFENLDVKKAIFAELSGIVRPEAILATNTSYQNVDEIAQACLQAGRVIGLHFFNPANIMRLLEIVPGKATEASVTATVLSLAKRLGKLAVVAGNCPGFIGNRMLRAYRREAHLLLEEGVSPKQVDSALEEWGMAMGPFAVQDLAGIDIAMSSRSAFAALERPDVREPRIMDTLFAQGRLGRKTGAGWYRYDQSGNAQPDPEVEALIDQAAPGRTRRSISPNEIADRTIYALINEGARILEEGYALRASDIDLVYINGYGFPAWRGGPMHYADETGLDEVCRRVVEFNRTPSPLLARLAESGGSFAEYGGR
jgi:3-hydroxyacyl-CoA dehydrogenase